MQFEDRLLPPEFATARGDPPYRRGVTSPDATSRPPTRSIPPMPALSARAVALLAPPRTGKRTASGGPRYAGPGADPPDPARLLRAAGRVSRQELLARPHVGPRLVAEIDAWLTAHGKRFREDPAPVADALAVALYHIQAMLDGNDADAFLSALVALPELRRSLAPRTGPRRGRR